ncbi:MAG: hypothetical protein ACREOP_09520, partial [Thermodesulfobacteriota bacterium]
TLLLLSVNTATAKGMGGEEKGGNHVHFCTDTANAQLTACRNEVLDDFNKSNAICIQVLDKGERTECVNDAKSARNEGNQLCKEQHEARRELCDAIGDDRYDPNFDPELFDEDFTNLSNPNPYFPLGITNMWKYAGGDEEDTVEVLADTKLIDGVTCIVVNDLVVNNEDGSREDTNDWYAQRMDGTVDYCGEETKDFKLFDGDNPMLPELVSIDGSFKAGRDGDLSGTIFLWTPTVGTTYRQEFSAGNAEDAATVRSVNYGYGSDPELDEFVPQDLAELLCADGDCVVTLDFTPISPDSFERKYYANGIGLFLEVNPSNGHITQLVDCNFDPRCAFLPTP